MIVSCIENGYKHLHGEPVPASMVNCGLKPKLGDVPKIRASKKACGKLEKLGMPTKRRSGPCHVGSLLVVS